MNNIFTAIAAIALLAVLKQQSKDSEENPEVTPGQKAERIVTFYKA